MNLCVLCVFVVRSTPSLSGMYLRIHFTHQTQESRQNKLLLSSSRCNLYLVMVLVFFTLLS
ncbi:MAG: hypothetical protein ACKO1G_04000 [Microcystis aeruginosa]